MGGVVGVGIDTLTQTQSDWSILISRRGLSRYPKQFIGQHQSEVYTEKGP